MNSPCYSGQIYQIKGRFYKVPRLVFDNAVKKVPSDVLDDLSDILERTIEILIKNKIFVMATAGTLLGAIRHNGSMIWDDDNDCVIYAKDIERIYQLKQTFKKCGYIVKKFNPGILIYKQGDPKIVVELFSLEWHPQLSKYAYAFPHNRHGKPLFLCHSVFPKETFTQKDLKVKMHRYNHFQIPVSINSTKLLKQFYSPKVLQSVRTTSSTKLHRFRRYEKAANHVFNFTLKFSDTPVKLVIKALRWYLK